MKGASHPAYGLAVDEGWRWVKAPSGKRLAADEGWQWLKAGSR